MSSASKYISGAIYTETILNTNAIGSSKNLAMVTAVGTSDLNFGYENRKVIYSLSQAQQMGYTNNSAYSLNSYLYRHFYKSSQPLVLFNVLDPNDDTLVEDFTETIQVVNNFATEFSYNPIQVSDTTFTVTDGVTPLVYGTDYVFTDAKLLRIINTALGLQEVTVTYKIINEANIVTAISDQIQGTTTVTSITKDTYFKNSGILHIPFYNNNIGLMQGLEPILSNYIMKTFASDYSVTGLDIYDEIQSSGNSTVYGALNNPRYVLVASEGSPIYLKSQNSILCPMDAASIMCAAVSGQAQNYNLPCGSNKFEGNIVSTKLIDYTDGYYENQGIAPVIEVGNKLLELGVNFLINDNGSYRFFGWFTSAKKTSTGEDAYSTQVTMRDFNSVLITNTLSQYLQQNVDINQLKLIEREVKNVIIANNQNFILSDDNGNLLFTFSLDSQAFVNVSNETQNYVRIPFNFQAVFVNSIESMYLTNNFYQEGFQTFINAIAEIGV